MHHVCSDSTLTLDTVVPLQAEGQKGAKSPPALVSGPGGQLPSASCAHQCCVSTEHQSAMGALRLCFNTDCMTAGRGAEGRWGLSLPSCGTKDRWTGCWRAAQLSRWSKTDSRSAFPHSLTHPLACLLAPSLTQSPLHPPTHSPFDHSACKSHVKTSCHSTYLHYDCSFTASVWAPL